MAVKTKERERTSRLGRFMDAPEPRRAAPATRPQAQPPKPPEPATHVAPVIEPEPEQPVKRATVRRERGQWRRQKQDEVPAGLVYGVIVVIAAVAVVATVVVNCGCSSFF